MRKQLRARGNTVNDCYIKQEENKAMSSMIASIFVPMVLISMVDGTEIHAVGDNFPTLEMCVAQAEADAKTMTREIEAIEMELAHPVIDHISITCEEMGAGPFFPEHEGYLPIEEASHVVQDN